MMRTRYVEGGQAGMSHAKVSVKLKLLQTGKLWQRGDLNLSSHTVSERGRLKAQVYPDIPMFASAQPLPLVHTREGLLQVSARKLVGGFCSIVVLQSEVFHRAMEDKKDSANINLRDCLRLNKQESATGR